MAQQGELLSLQHQGYSLLTLKGSVGPGSWHHAGQAQGRGPAVPPESLGCTADSSRLPTRWPGCCLHVSTAGAPGVQLSSSGRGWGPWPPALWARRRLHILRITSLWALRRFRSFSFSLRVRKSFLFRASKSRRA